MLCGAQQFLRQRCAPLHGPIVRQCSTSFKDHEERLADEYDTWTVRYESNGDLRGHRQYWMKADRCISANRREQQVRIYGDAPAKHRSGFSSSSVNESRTICVHNPPSLGVSVRDIGAANQLRATTETKSKGHRQSRLMNSARVVYEIDD
jgi:hypothetical protein